MGDAEKGASDREEGSEEPEDEDKEIAEEHGALDTGVKDLDSRLAQSVETFEVPHGEPPVWTDAATASASGAEWEARQDGSSCQIIMWRLLVILL